MLQDSQVYQVISIEKLVSFLIMIAKGCRARAWKLFSYFIFLELPTNTQQD